MAAMVPVTQNRQPREGEKWFYEFGNFMKQFPEIQKNLGYLGFQFFDYGKEQNLRLGGVFRTAGNTEITKETIKKMADYSSSKIETILFMEKLEPYGKNCIVVLLR